jgi:hypothetical protein
MKRQRPAVGAFCSLFVYRFPGKIMHCDRFAYICFLVFVFMRIEAKCKPCFSIFLKNATVPSDNWVVPGFEENSCLWRVLYAFIINTLFRDETEVQHSQLPQGVNAVTHRHHIIVGSVENTSCSNVSTDIQIVFTDTNILARVKFNTSGLSVAPKKFLNGTR